VKLRTAHVGEQRLVGDPRGVAWSVRVEQDLRRPDEQSPRRVDDRDPRAEPRDVELRQKAEGLAVEPVGILEIAAQLAQIPSSR
jgi:hypothetical protein